MSASSVKLYWRQQLAAHQMQKFADRELASVAQITTAQIGVLTVISNSEGINHKDVARALGLNESAVTAMVRRLVAQDLVRSNPCKTDRRAKVLSLTSTGRTVQNSAKITFDVINKKIEATLSAGEIELLAELLDRLKESFTIES